jgi:dTDP-4-dehydrorhamnose reductase
LLGSLGQVGWELQRSLAPFGSITAGDRQECDLADADALRRFVADARPDIIVNAGAYTAVDKAEQDTEAARRVNADAAALLAEEAKQRGALLVHYSTDYVYDGTKEGAYLETDATNPLSVYGRTKLQGDEAIQASGCQHLIFRTSWVFAARGGNFAKTMLRLAGDRESLNVIADQFGAPTSAELLADVTALAIRDVRAGRVPGGLYHLTAVGETSWHGYASFVIAEARRLGLALKAGPDSIHPIPTEAYPLPARRPANSRLALAKVQEAFGLALPPWQYHVRRMIEELYGER